jgi:Zn-dependent protease with chaperone function
MLCCDTLPAWRTLERRRSKPTLNKLAYKPNLEEQAAQPNRSYKRQSTVVGSRLGDTSRSLCFDDGAKVESKDNDEIDRLATLWGQRASIVHRLESNWRVVVAAVVLIVAVAWSGFVWGVPWAARRIAMALPAEVVDKLGKGTLAALDKLMFSPSEVQETRQEELRQSFERLAANYRALPLTLNFRKMGIPNAFALPDGSVIVTDELIKLAKNNEEIMGVLAHEIGHVKHRHMLRMTLEASAVGLFSMVTFGDASSASALFAGLPSVYANAQYSQAKESEADEFAISYMQNLKLHPSALADILQRMSETLGESKTGVPKYFSSHPSTESRLQKLRAAEKATVP